LLDKRQGQKILGIEPTEPPQSRRLCTEHVSHRCGELLSNVVIKLERTSVASHSADIIADIGVAL